MPLNNVPLAGQTLAQTRDPIRNNFNSINTAFNVNHVDFGLADQGKHKWVTLINQAASPAFGASETGLFNAISVLTNVQETFVHTFLNNGAATSNIGLTSSILSTSIPGIDSNGWAFLPSGILLKWGRQAAAAFPASTIITFPVAANIPVFTQVFNAQITVKDTVATGNFAITSHVSALTTTNMTVFTNNQIQNASIYYFVIGF